MFIGASLCTSLSLAGWLTDWTELNWIDWAVVVGSKSTMWNLAHRVWMDGWLGVGACVPAWPSNRSARLSSVLLSIHPSIHLLVGATDHDVNSAAEDEEEEQSHNTGRLSHLIDLSISIRDPIEGVQNCSLLSRGWGDNLMTARLDTSLATGQTVVHWNRI